jgi:hypothetical protein
MGTLRRRTGAAPQHRATVRPRWMRPLARHRWHAAIAGMAGAAALASGAILLLPGPATRPAAGGCGLVTCTARLPAPASTEPSAGTTQAPAPPPASQPAQPGPSAPPASPSPTQQAPHHGQARGLIHRRHGRWAHTA